MRRNLPCDFPAGYDGMIVIQRLAQVLDPELDEPILDLGFVRSFELRSGHASIELRPPTRWCSCVRPPNLAKRLRQPAA